MTNNELENLLKKLGLDEKESQIYLTLIEYGPSPASIIATKIDQKRTTIYYILDSLIKKGFIRQIIYHNIKYFSPLDPTSLSDVVEKKIGELNDVKKELKTKLAVLQTMQNKPIDRPKISYFEGRDGIKKAYEDLLSSKTEILEIDLPDDIHASLGEEWVKNFVKERIGKKIPLKAIIPKTRIGQKYTENDPKEYRETILLDPKNKMTIHSSISIYDNKINIINLKKNFFGIIIENPDLYGTMRTLYRLAWGQAQTKAIVPEKKKKKK